MELAISAAESANTAVATNMGVSGKALKPERLPRWLPNTLPAQGPFNSFGLWHVTHRTIPGEIAWVYEQL
jgi:hypothetical protein